MTFLQVQYFLKVYETGSVSSAAKELFMTRSALSKAVRELEEEFGAPLFERTKIGLSPTPAGETLHLKALELVLLMDETGDVMRSAVSSQEETVNVGVTPTTGITIFPRVYRELGERYPEIRLMPIEGGNTKAQNMLESGRMDACFTTYSELFPDAKGRLSITENLDSLKLGETGLVLCVPPRHRFAEAESVSVEEFADEPMVFLKKPLQREAELLYRFNKLGASPRVVFRASQLSTARQLVRCGMALSVQMRGALDDGREIIGVPLSPPATYSNVLIWNRMSVRKRGFKKFLEYCRTGSLD